MHVLIIHQAFASLDEPGGTRHFEFARLLADQGHRVTVIASPVSYITGAATAAGARDGHEQADGISILRAPVYGAHHRSFADRTLAFLSFMVSSLWMGLWVRHVDLVWGTSPPIFQGVTGWALARIKRARFLFEVRDLWPLFAVAVGILRSPILIRASKWLERFLYRHADCVMVNSPAFAEHVTRRGARRVELVPNGADPRMFDPSDDGKAFRSRYSLQGKFVVLYAGAHGMSNDLDVLMDAAKLLKGGSVQLVLLGDGKEKRRLEQRAADLGLDNVTFAAPVAKSEMPGALAAADACIAILKPLEEYKTTYPNKVFDYMAAGRPVVLAIDGVIRRVVEEAGCGLFAQPGNPATIAQAIATLAADPGKRRQMGLAGRRYLEQNFSRDRIGQKLVKLMLELIGETGSTQPWTR